MNLEIIIPSDEPVRLLNAVTEELDYRRLTATYSRLGRNEYSPRLLFKIVLYGCSRGIYRTREIERACRENVNFMYLLEGHRPPDHNSWEFEKITKTFQEAKDTKDKKYRDDPYRAVNF